jgi:hypothetical protein
MEIFLVCYFKENQFKITGTPLCVFTSLLYMINLIQPTYPPSQYERTYETFTITEIVFVIVGELL